MNLLFTKIRPKITELHKTNRTGHIIAFKKNTQQSLHTTQEQKQNNDIKESHSKLREFDVKINIMLLKQVLCC